MIEYLKYVLRWKITVLTDTSLSGGRASFLWGPCELSLGVHEDVRLWGIDKIETGHFTIWIGLGPIFLFSYDSYLDRHFNP